MLTIKKQLENDVLNVKLEGRLDTTTAPELDDELKASLPGVKELIFDFEALEYVSSAGLRVLLSAQKVMNKQGSMKLINVRDEVKEIFDVTGFSDILTIE
jgi:anti-sigma B factor antagonist